MAVMADTVPTIQMWPNKTHVRSYPPWDGIHDEGLELEAIQTGESHDPNDRGAALSPLSQQSNQRPGGGYQLLYNTPGN
jgi:hypothetical protein